MAGSARVVRTVATATSVAYGGLLLAFGQTPTGGAKQAVAYLPAAAGLLAVLWDASAWHWPGLRRLAKRPVVYGTWAAVLSPSADSCIPRGGNRGPIKAFVVIVQTFWSVHVTLHTAESTSRSTAASLRDLGGGQQGLAYTYGNTPRQEHLHRSPKHAGASDLIVVGTAPEEITGMYWTDRLTHGDMDLVLVDRKTDRPNFAACAAAAAAARLRRQTMLPTR
jgi:SMODS-associating 2TM, beta-strand rich effector domain